MRKILIKDGRAVFGATALVLTGAILSSMVYQYFAGQYTGEALVRSRAWWEIVLNLQVLCLGFMWFCYADRVRTSDPVRAFFMRLLMVVGLVAVSIPFLIAVCGVYFGWFEDRPSMRVVDIIVCVLVGFWVVSVITPKLLLLKGQGQRLNWANIKNTLTPKPWITALPGGLGMLVIVVDWFFGPVAFYFLIPFLFYTQSAIPFLQKAFVYHQQGAHSS